MVSAAGGAAWASAAGAAPAVSSRASTPARRKVFIVVSSEGAQPQDRLHGRKPHLNVSFKGRAAHANRQPLASLLGPVAQWLEPAAHNGLVAGSSPAGPTSEAFHGGSARSKPSP